jgi:hypothetical protein
MTTHLRTGLALLVAVAALVTGCADDVTSGAGDPPASEEAPGGAGLDACMLVMTYDGARFEGAPGGPPDRAPVLTGRSATASLATCDDGAGPDSGGEVEVEEIDGVALETAFWHQGSIMVREGADLPQALDPLYRAPTCELAGEVEVRGQWLGVVSKKKPRFDGDLRPPLRIQLYVEETSDAAADLDRYTIWVRDDGTARPALDKTMAEEALWSSRAALETVLVCSGGRFQARSFALAPR